MADTYLGALIQRALHGPSIFTKPLHSDEYNASRPPDPTPAFTVRSPIEGSYESSSSEGKKNKDR